MAAVSWTGKTKPQDHLWTDGKNWSTGAEPGAGDDVTIDISGGTVNMNSTTDTVDSLAIGSGNRLTLNSSSLTVDNGGSNAGLVTINGSDLIVTGTETNTNSITLNGSSLMVAGNLALAGAGRITLTNSVGDDIVSDGSPATITTSNNIEGGGQIGDADLTLTNTGKIDATGGSQITVATGSNVITNISGGVMEATTAGTLVIDGTVANSGGTIEAVGAGSTVDLSDAVIEGGKLNGNNGDLIVSSDNTTVLDGRASAVTVDGDGEGTQVGGVVVEDGATLELRGTIDMSASGFNAVAGAINLESQGDPTELLLAGVVTLKGGVVSLIDGNTPGNVVAGDGFALLNLDAHIQGAGQVGDDYLTINVGSTGMIQDATGDTANPMVIDAASVTNDGWFWSSNGSDIVVQSIVDNVNPALGHFKAIGSSFIDLDNGYVAGGTLETDSTSVIDTYVNPNTSLGSSGNVLDGTGAGNPVNIDGNFVVQDGTSITLAGIINVNPVGVNKNVGSGAIAGTFTLNSTGDDTIVQIDGGGATLGGGGQIVLADNGASVASPGAPQANFIEGTLVHTNLVNDDVISGSGEIERVVLTNNGTIDANAADPLIVDTGTAEVANAGTLEATNGGTLGVDNGVSNTGGTIIANDGNVNIGGPVIGGHAELIGSGNLQLGSQLTVGTASTVNVTFAAGATGTLILADSVDFAGTVSGWSSTGSNAIDCQDIQYVAGETACTYNGGILTVSDGTAATTANISLASAPLGGLSFTADSTGGTIVVDPTGPATVSSSFTTDISGGDMIEPTLTVWDGTAHPYEIADAAVIADGTTVSVAGNIDVDATNGGSLALASTGDLTIMLVNSTGATFTGGGQIVLQDNPSAANFIEGTTQKTDLVNDDDISGAGTIQRAVLTNNGTIDANAADPLVINTGTSAVINNGLLEAENGGDLIVLNNVNNANGDIQSNGATVSIDGTVTGGTAELSGTGTLEIAGSTVKTAPKDNVAVTFEAGATGTLTLDDSKSFTGSVTGLAADGSNALDLTDVRFTSKTTVSYNANTGVLTVDDNLAKNPDVANITLLGQAMSSTFVIASDGQGGTLVTEQGSQTASLAATPAIHHG